MPNEKKIKARIVECGLTIGKISTEMNMCAYTLGRKISGKAIMSLPEAWQLMEILNIPDEDFKEYFFDFKVA